MRFKTSFRVLLLLGVGALAWLFLRSSSGTLAMSGAGRFRVPSHDLSNPLKIVAYGDMRFTNPAEQEATNPKVRRWLVDRIAVERPDAVLLSGDVPWHGSESNDYQVYRSETRIWHDAKLRIYPALGNHEFQGQEKTCLENWWRAFPELRGLRYYSVQLGDSVYALNLDSNLALTPASDQFNWIKKQLANLPSTILFVIVNLHHPPFVDFQEGGDDSHNGRPNEAALAGLLTTEAAKASVRFIVVAGHIHNYERFEEAGIVYLVSGGGGAKPRPVTRQPKDRYQDPGFPNYHYVTLTLNSGKLLGTMTRVADPSAATPTWEVKDGFEIAALPSKAVTGQ